MKPPKLDWTPTDYYNVEDLNRVEHNTAVVFIIAQQFASVPSLTFMTLRKMDHIEFTDSLNRVEQNLSTLAMRYTPVGWIAPKTDWQTNDSFGYQDANRLESNINLLYQYYWGNALNFKYCGNYTCGEDVM